VQEFLRWCSNSMSENIYWNWNWRELFILRPVGLEDWIDTIRYDTIRDAILTCAQKLTYVSLIHRAYRRFTKPPRLFRRVSSRIIYNVFSWRRRCWSTAVSEAIKGYNNLIGSTVQGRRHAMLMPVEIISTATHRLRRVYLLGCLQMDCNKFMTLNVTEGHWNYSIVYATDHFLAMS